MKTKKLLMFAIAALAIAVISVGCGGATTEEPQKNEPAATENESSLETPAPSEGGAAGIEETEVEEMTEGASVKFTEPAEGAEVAGPDVTVTIETAGFTLANKLNQPNVEGEGHVHWIVDGAKPQPSPEATFKAVGLSAGEHTVKAELHQNMHEPLDPAVEATVKFMVK